MDYSYLSVNVKLTSHATATLSAITFAVIPQTFGAS